MEASMEAAAVLLSLAMRDTENPVADLCAALQRIGGSLAELRAHAAASGRGELRKDIETDVAVCIESLQFHDRLIQQLAAVRGLLASVVEDSPPQQLAGFSAHRWEEMLSALRDRLSTDSHHRLFNLLLRTGIVDGGGQPNLQAAEGSVELF
jgi:hypothetical protein